MFKSFSRRTAQRSLTSMILIGALALSACDEAIVVAPGAIDKNDSCSRFQMGIVDARQKSNQLRVQNAIAGAVVGGIIGASVAGGDREERRRGAVIGAVLGGVVAGAATADQQNRAAQADAALLRDVNTKAGQARGLLTEAGRNANALRSCRLTQIRTLESNVRNGRVSTSTARSQLAVLKRRANADNQIISASFNGIGNRVDSFVNTTAQSSGVESAIVTRQKAARTPVARQVRAATPNVPAAISTKNRLVAEDTRQRKLIDNELEGAELLLG